MLVSDFTPILNFLSTKSTIPHVVLNDSGSSCQRCLHSILFVLVYKWLNLNNHFVRFIGNACLFDRWNVFGGKRVLSPCRVIYVLSKHFLFSKLHYKFATLWNYFLSCFKNPLIITFKKIIICKCCLLIKDSQNYVNHNKRPSKTGDAQRMGRLLCHK